MKKKPSPDRVDRFIYYLYLTSDPVEAARRSGIDEVCAIKLASSRGTQRKLSRLYNMHENDLCKARAGLERLAFGRINDAAELVFSCDEEGGFSRYDGADLFMVSEMKKVKGGGVEVKFFDRLKAIEQLIELDELIERKQSSGRFLTAFGKALADGGEADDR